MESLDHSWSDGGVLLDDVNDSSLTYNDGIDDSLYESSVFNDGDTIGSSQQDPLLTFDGNLLPTSFRLQSAQITGDVIRYISSGDNESESPTSKSASIMRSLVDDLLRTRLSSMRQLADRLDVQRPEDVVLLNSVATSMFDDDVVTWNRIVTLFAFAGYLARHCRERGLLECSEMVIQVLDSIIVERLGLWILASGGWVSLNTSSLVLSSRMMHTLDIQQQLL